MHGALVGVKNADVGNEVELGSLTPEWLALLPIVEPLVLATVGGTRDRSNANADPILDALAGRLSDSVRLEDEPKLRRLVNILYRLVGKQEI